MATLKRDPILEVEDEDFLSQVAALEADALSAKRRKVVATVISSASTATATTSATNLSKPKTNGEAAAAAEAEAEGAYTAALRGSRSLSFQDQSSRPNGPPKLVAFSNPEFSGSRGGGTTVVGGGGPCFKCGKSGHWARDCDADSNAHDKASVPEKACPCGLGACFVLTANTEKNRGRKFYKCPLREENGGCGFFEWCDKSIGTDDMNVRNQGNASITPLPDVSCPCGAGFCLILKARTGKNIGQPFYCCPANEGNSCGFFKWCHDHTFADNLPVLASASPVYKINEMSNKNFGTRSGSSCFRCGKDGHWARDCLPPPIQNPAPNLGGNSASSNTCYKCGMPGHWAKDCSSTS